MTVGVLLCSPPKRLTSGLLSSPPDPLQSADPLKWCREGEKVRCRPPVEKHSSDNITVPVQETERRSGRGEVGKCSVCAGERILGGGR
ncbi:hypothetical protein FKM82_026081 [Ascaphus truei]